MVRPELFAALRTTTLRSDDAGQTALLNQLLRNFLEHNLIDQAQKLASKTAFPESASNSEAARYLFYLGRIEAIQLECVATCPPPSPSSVCGLDSWCGHVCTPQCPARLSCQMCDNRSERWLTQSRPRVSKKASTVSNSLSMRRTLACPQVLVGVRQPRACDPKSPEGCSWLFAGGKQAGCDCQDAPWRDSGSRDVQHTDPPAFAQTVRSRPPHARVRPLPYSSRRLSVPILWRNGQAWHTPHRLACLNPQVLGADAGGSGG